MKTILHKSNTRGHANHGWLNSYHSFSFAGYQDFDRMNFGALRVLNDDTVAGGMGFGAHPHNNMEIISIPTEGELEHSDDMGNSQVMRAGDVQVMSAGTGIRHSEKNKSDDKQVKFFQIWIFPNKRNVTPRYDQKSINPADLKNNLFTIISPVGNTTGAVQIHQDAWFSMGTLDQDVVLEYSLKKKGNGIYVFVIEGNISVNGQMLEYRDGMGITETELLQLKAIGYSKVLLMEIPMEGF